MTRPGGQRRGAARLRVSRTALVPVGMLLLCTVPVASASPWGLPVLLLPLAAAAWVLRTGVDVDDAGVTARSVLASRRVPWPQVAGVRVDEREELWLVTTGGTDLRLPSLRARDLPRLAAVSGGRIPDPTGS